MGDRLRVYLCVRADDRRTWPWRYGVDNVAGFVVVAKGARPSNLTKVSKEVRGLGELWFWLGGSSDDVVDHVLKIFNGVKGLLKYLRSLGFNGVLGPDYTVFWSDESRENYRKFVKYLEATTELLLIGNSFVIPQVKAIESRYVREVLMKLKDLGAREILYNASFDLEDSFYDGPEVVVGEAKSLGLRIWLAVPGWLRDLNIVAKLRPNNVILWRHLTRLAYPRRSPKEELRRLINDLRCYGWA